MFSGLSAKEDARAEAEDERIEEATFALAHFRHLHPLTIHFVQCKALALGDDGSGAIPKKSLELRQIVAHRQLSLRPLVALRRVHGGYSTTRVRAVRKDGAGRARSSPR